VKVAIISEVYLPKIDGVVGRTVNLIQQLQKAGDEVLVICPEVKLPRNSPVPVIEFRGFPCSSYPEYIIGMPDRTLIDGLAEFQPDVIHFLNPFAFGFQCYDLISREPVNIPIVFSFHTLYGEFVKKYRGLSSVSKLIWWLSKSYHNRAAVNLTVSVPIEQELRQRGFERVTLWPPAVDATMYSPNRRSDAMRRKLSGDHPESPLLLTVSRLAPEKNVEFLIRILRQVPEARLAIVGGGPQREELERLFAGYPATFIGYLEGEKLAEAYASADAFVYASETETMGNVILEAMASGLPVCAAAAGGVPSLVNHGIDGFLYEPGCEAEAVGYLRQLLNQPEFRQQISDAAVRSASARTWNEAAMSVRRNYQQAIDGCIPAQMTSERVSRAARICTQTLVRLFQVAAALHQNYTSRAHRT
jgi:glycosyltransferase involved in cell wall biosynthesis